MTDGEDDEPKKPVLKLVTESSGGDDGNSGRSNITQIGYSGEEPEEPEESDKQDDDAPGSSVTHELLREDILKIMEALNPREKSILELRFGLKDGKTRKLEEVALLIGTTRERIRQIEAKALRKLRHPNRSQRYYKNALPPNLISRIESLSWHEIQSKLSEFKSLDRRIIKMLWGFTDGDCHTKSEVAQKFEVTEDYVIELDIQAKKLFEIE